MIKLMQTSTIKDYRNTLLSVFLILFAFLVLPGTYADSGDESGKDGKSSDQQKLYQQAKKDIKAGNYNEAISKLDGLNTELPGDADVLNLLGYSNRKITNYVIAEQYYKQALKVDPKHKNAHEYLGELYVETERMDLARQQLAKLDGLCVFTCKQYKKLKRYIEAAEKGQQPAAKKDAW